MKTPEEIAAERADFEEIDAMCALQGFTPDAFTLECRERFYRGEITIKDALSLGREYYLKKTLVAA